MKKNRFYMLLLLLTMIQFQLHAQTNLVCNDMVFVSLDEDCNITVKSQQVLEGSYCCYDTYVVEIDKVLPLGNGPWVPAILTNADIGKTYQVRVTEPVAGNKCWGNIKAEDKNPPNLNCSSASAVNLDANGSATLQVSTLQVTTTDACTPSAQLTLSLPNGQTSINYDCANKGANLVSLVAKDASGNTSSCVATVIVNDPTGNCNSPCVTDCPASQVVTFDHAINVLLPALQSNNLTPFDTYGNPVFNTAACPLEDTTYAVTYTPESAGFSWFKRSWTVYMGGTPFGKCDQLITFPSSRIFNFSGKIYLDSIINCEPDAGEIGTGFFKLLATKLPGNEQFTVTPNNLGIYTADIPVNGKDSVIELRLQLPNGLSTACPNVIVVPAFGPQINHIFNVGLVSELNCPLLGVSLNMNLIRRCLTSSWNNFVYTNKSFMPANNAYVTLELDPLLSITNASKPFIKNGNVYTFQLGTVPRLSSSSVNFTLETDCDAELGQTLCGEAIIYPHDPCDGQAYTGPKVSVKARCENNNTVQLILENIGDQDMQELRDFIVVEDILMRDGGQFKLNKGAQKVLSYAANGATWRLEAQQVNGYPGIDRPAVSLEGCNGINTPGLVNAFAFNDDPIYIDNDCAEVRGSYDPNDKIGVPTGYNPAHIITANTDLEYKIRFQNTGTDTAFTVVVVDSLSDLLDFRTLEAGAASHKYRLDVYPGGILHFVFENIMLPDSNVDKDGSNGFLKFRIAQKPNLPIGSVLKNKAAIYFDKNAPIITNEAFHTIGAPYVMVSTFKPELPDVQVVVQPNPFMGEATLQISGYEAKDGILHILDAQGRAVHAQTFSGNQTVIQGNKLPNGFYFFQIFDAGQLIGSGKLEKF
jgi:uncharacterized repeat protein (TIGR01451 family)